MGRLNSIETIDSRGGRGVRCVMYFQGCPMRCLYCNRKDTWEIDGGFELDSRQVIKKAMSHVPYLSDEKSIIISGGEPFMQDEFLLDVLKGCKEEGFHTTVDTCGYYLTPYVKQALNYIDHLILDIKHTSYNGHEELTGCSISYPLSFLEYLTIRAIPFTVRQVIIPGWNDTGEDMKRLSRLLAYIPSLKGVELIPYSDDGVSESELIVPDNDSMTKLRYLFDIECEKLGLL